MHTYVYKTNDKFYKEIPIFNSKITKKKKNSLYTISLQKRIWLCQIHKSVQKALFALRPIECHFSAVLKDR